MAQSSTPKAKPKHVTQSDTQKATPQHAAQPRAQKATSQQAAQPKAQKAAANQVESQTPLLEFFATTQTGFEFLLAQELKQLGMKRVRPLQGGVAFFAMQEQGYKACLWSRLAGRILQVVARVGAHDAQQLYRNTQAIAWETWVGPHATISVTARGTNAELRNTQFTALKVKDAVCDRLRDVRSMRPDVSSRQADVPLSITVHKEKATLYLDYAGEGLHKRGYRPRGKQHEAPLRETLAAGMLMWAGWPEALLNAADAERVGNTNFNATANAVSSATNATVNAITNAVDTTAYTAAPASNTTNTTSATAHAAVPASNTATDAPMRTTATTNAAVDVLTIASANSAATSTAPLPVFVDPVCGSGTLVLEAAMMAAHRAPGLTRGYWGFAGHANFNAEAFDALLDEADKAFEQGLQTMPTLLGADVDPEALAMARASAKYLGFAKHITLVPANCAQLQETFATANISPDKPGFMAMNPPYGMRLQAGELTAFYHELTQGLSYLTDAWRLVVITPDANFDAAIGLDAQETFPAHNGPIEATLRTYTLGTSAFTPLTLVTLTGVECVVEVSSPHAEQFAARLRKMAKQRRKWAQRENIHAYRVYDSDLPDYAVSVDIFEGRPVWENTCDAGLAGSEELYRYVLVTEYKAPAEIDATKAARRFNDACTIAQALFEVPGEHLVTRRRQRAKGGSQYSTIKQPHRADANFKQDISSQRSSAAGLKFDQPRKPDQLSGIDAGLQQSGRLGGNSTRPDRPGANSEQSSTLPANIIHVVEAGHPFEVNFDNYLDTGLFLDHRITRQIVGEYAAGGHFLNLFAYTATASVYAAAAGALSTTTVDMNNTYLEWARSNMQASGFTGKEHTFVRADVLSWIGHAIRERFRYDTVFVDPPTFSNSKTMGKRTWDIQRDHAALLTNIGKVLNPEGTIIFSGNLRSFKLDGQALARAGLQAQNITAKTIPPDFARNPKIHFCYVITQANVR